MYDTDMVLVQDSDQVIVAVDLWSESRVPPSPDQYFEGGFDDVTLEAAGSSDGVLTAQVRRALVTGDPYDFELSVNLDTDLCFAYASGTDFGFHGQNYGFGRIVFANEQKNARWDLYDKYYKSDYDHHSTVMTIMWLGVANLAIIIARYFKWWKYWFYLHFVLSGFLTGFTIFSAYSIYIVNETMLYTYTSDQRYHSRVGITVASLVMAQVFLGILTRAFIYFKSAVIPIMVIRKAHHFLGWGLLIAGLINAWLGWKMYDDSKHTFLTILYVFLCIIYTVLESWGFLYSRIKAITTEAPSEEQQRLVSKTKNHHKIYKSIVREKKEWVFYDEMLLDVSGYINSHPGGSNMLRSVIGEDVGKYLNGSSSLPSFGPNYHSPKAFSFAKTMKIADLGFDRQILVGPYDQDKMEWEVVDKFKVCESTFCIVLSSEKWSLAEPEGTDWIGKHFLVTIDEFLLTRRYYSCVVCSLKDWNEGSSRHIRLYIKPYIKGKVSNAITSKMINERVILKGPMGPGLMLSSIKVGVYMALAGGTGILPFMDLVHLVWENKAPQGFVLFIYASFGTEGDVFAVQLIREAAEKFPDKIRLQTHISSLGKECLLSTDKITEIAQIGKLRKVWVCGSAGFSGFIRDMLSQASIVGKKVVNL